MSQWNDSCLECKTNEKVCEPVKCKEKKFWVVSSTINFDPNCHACDLFLICNDQERPLDHPIKKANTKACWEYCSNSPKCKCYSFELGGINGTGECFTFGSCNLIVDDSNFESGEVACAASDFSARCKENQFWLVSQLSNSLFTSVIHFQSNLILSKIGTTIATSNKAREHQKVLGALFPIRRMQMLQL